VNKLKGALGARRMQDRPLGGVGRALANVVELRAEEAQILLLTNASGPEPPIQLPQYSSVHPPERPRPYGSSGALPALAADLRRIFHGTFKAVPYHLYVPAVVTIHDLSFDAYPEDAIRNCGRSS
jgi:hypothetical protein